MQTNEEDAELKLIDFGFACEVEMGHEEMFERLGTLSYMAPELLDSNKKSAYDSSFARLKKWSSAEVPKCRVPALPSAATWLSDVGRCLRNGIEGATAPLSLSQSAQPASRGAC